MNEFLIEVELCITNEESHSQWIGSGWIVKISWIGLHEQREIYVWIELNSQYNFIFLIYIMGARDSHI